MRRLDVDRTRRLKLVAIRLAHTIVWAFLAGCIVAIPVASWLRRHREAGWLIAIVMVEVGVLALSGGSCPLTAVAARYTENRRPNFDIYLPEWLARNNQLIFGTLFGVGIVFACARWWLAAT